MLTNDPRATFASLSLTLNQTRSGKSLPAVVRFTAERPNGESQFIRERAMSILTVFELSSMTTEKYAQAIRGLEAAGQGSSEGRMHHVASVQEDDSIIVIDVWKSAELLVT